MRSSRRRLRTPTKAAAGEPVQVDLGASARQVGQFETANGLPHGLAEIVVALGAALLRVPTRAIWRALTGRGGDRS